MSQINVSNLTFSYPGSYDNIFENVSFQLDTDWKLGFTGRNGRGKTTFLNLLMDKYEYSGLISSSVRFEYFPYEIDINTETSDVFSKICPGCFDWQIEKELSLLDVSDDVLIRLFSTLSEGERTKVLLCALFLKENSFLLIDEPTNHLDMKGRGVLSKYFRSKGGFILVSHDRIFLDNCVDHILSINRTNIEVQQGNFSTWLENKTRQDNFELAENRRLKSDIKRLKEASQRTSKWSDDVEKSKFGQRVSGIKPDKGYIGHKAAKMMKHSKSIETRQQAAIDEKSKLLKNIETSDSLKLLPASYHKTRLAELENVSVCYGVNTVFSGVSFTVERGERIAIVGKNGSGKSSIIKLISGVDMPCYGNVLIGAGLNISYVPQDTSFLSGDLREYAYENGIDESLFKAILRKLDFSRLQFEKDIKSFSAGQKKKVLIAKSLCEKAHLYLWDEPLNYIDVISRMQIESLILDHKPTMLFVEHDKAFVEKVATKIVEL